MIKIFLIKEGIGMEFREIVTFLQAAKLQSFSKAARQQMCIRDRTALVSRTLPSPLPAPVRPSRFWLRISPCLLYTSRCV